MRFDVMAIPTLVVFNNGEVVGRDYAEWLCAQALGGKLHNNSRQSSAGVLLPAHVVAAVARSVGRFTGHRFILSGPMLNHPESEDMTESLRSAAQA